MVYNILVNVPTAGTAVQLAAARTPAVWVRVTADPDNGGQGYAGGVNPSSKGSAAGVSAMEPLSPGGSTLLPPCSDTNFYDLSKLYVNADSNDENFRITYATR